MIAYAVLAFVVTQRLAELLIAQRNTRALLEKGAVEIGHAHYPLFVVLHTAWLLTIFFALPRSAHVHVAPLLAYFILEALRVWTMVSLGRYWTTRIVTVPDAPLVRRGPYRFVRHPNYLIVIGEIALLPLVFGEVWVAVAFSVLNGALLLWRVRKEESALASRLSR